MKSNIFSKIACHMAIAASLEALSSVGLLGTLKSLRFGWASTNFPLASHSLLVLQKQCRKSKSIYYLCVESSQHTTLIWPAYGTLVGGGHSLLWYVTMCVKRVFLWELLTSLFGFKEPFK